VLFLPWLAGSMSPASASDMRGGFLGMTLDTERADLLRATVEGVARNLRWLLPAVEDLSGTPAAEMVLAGGAHRARGRRRCSPTCSTAPCRCWDRPELAAATAVGRVALARTAARTRLGRPPRRGDTAARARSDAVHDRLQPLFEQAFSANRPICQALES
jgi:xylulokinase